MGWEIISEKTESVEDKNPDTYVKRAEHKLSKGDIQNAVKEIDTAIAYCEPVKKYHYIYEKAKILFAANQNKNCVHLMLHQLDYFHHLFDSKKFVKAIELLIKSGNYSNKEIKKILSEKNIPSSAVDTNHINLRKYFLTKAKQEQSRSNTKDALKAIEIALTYCDNKKDVHLVLYEKVEILYMARKFYDCYRFIQDHIADFYANLTIDYFRDLLDLLIKTIESPINDVKEFLTSKNIPWVILNEMDGSTLNYHYLNSKADKYLLDENYELTLQYCDLSIKVNPSQSYPFIMKGQCYDNLKRYNDALRSYNRAIRYAPEIIDTYNKRGLVRMECSDFKGALSDFDQAVQLDRESGSYLKNRARALMHLNRFAEAKKSLLSAITLGKNKSTPDAEAHYLMGILYDTSNRFINAHYSYKRALSIDAKYTIPLNSKRKRRLLYFKLLIALCLSAVTVGTIMGYKYYGDVKDGENIEQVIQGIFGVAEAVQKEVITEKRETIYKHKELIPHESIEQETNALQIGESEVVQIGVDGFDVVTYRITYDSNGHLESNVEIDRERESQPVTEIINIGTMLTGKQTESEIPSTYSLMTEDQSEVETDIKKKDVDLTKLDGIPIHSSNLAFENSLGTYRYIKDNDSTAKHDIQYTLTLFNDNTYVLTSTHLDNFIDKYSNSFPGEITIGYTSGFVVDGNFEVSTKMDVEFSSVDNYLNKIQSKITQKINGNYYEDGIQIQGYLQSLNDMITIIEANEDTITLNYGGMNRITLLRVPDEYQYGFKEILEEYDGVYQ